MKAKISLRTVLARSKRNLLKRSYRLVDHLFDSDHYTRYRLRQAGYDSPDYSFASDQICFIHLPKTGGTSLSKTLKTIPGDKFVNLDIHRPISAHCSPRDFQYITILREPVARVWSYYQMVLREYDGYPYQKYARRGLQAFLEGSWQARNMYCRYLSGKVYAEPDETTLRQSLENLSKFYRVMRFDNFSAGITKFLEEQQLPYQGLPHERKASYDSLSPSDRELISRYNQLDKALYEAWLANSDNIVEEP